MLVIKYVKPKYPKKYGIIETITNIIEYTKMLIFVDLTPETSGNIGIFVLL